MEPSSGGLFFSYLIFFVVSEERFFDFYCNAINEAVKLWLNETKRTLRKIERGVTAPQRLESSNS